MSATRARPTSILFARLPDRWATSARVSPESVGGAGRLMLRLRLAHFDAVLAQPIDRAANLAPQCTRRVRLHRDQQIAGAGILYFAKRLRNREVTRVGFSAQLAQFCDPFSNRRRGIESQFVQPRLAKCRVLSSDSPRVCFPDEVASDRFEASKLFGGLMNCQVLFAAVADPAGFSAPAGM